MEMEHLLNTVNSKADALKLAVETDTRHFEQKLNELGACHHTATSFQLLADSLKMDTLNDDLKNAVNVVEKYSEARFSEAEFLRKYTDRHRCDLGSALKQVVKIVGTLIDIHNTILTSTQPHYEISSDVTVASNHNVRGPEYSLIVVDDNSKTPEDDIILSAKKLAQVPVANLDLRTHPTGAKPDAK